MRHLMSLVLSIVAAPLLYVAAGYATVKVDAATAAGGIHWGDAGLGIVAALLAGALYAVLVMARLSPLGPVLAGLAFAGVTVWSLVARASLESAFSLTILGQPRLLLAPVGAGTLLLAVPLLVTIASPRRWRGSAGAGATGYDAAPSYAGTVSSAAPTYGEATETPTYAPSSYAPTEYTPPVYTPASYGTTTYTPPAQATGSEPTTQAD